MTRDYKPSAPKQRSSGRGSVFFSGFLLGLIVGVGAAVGVAVFVKGGESPFTTNGTNAAAPMPAGQAEPFATPAKGGGVDESPEAQAKRFDFYKILPGSEPAVTSQAAKKPEAAAQAQPPATVAKPSATPAESYYLQVGAFQTEQEADNVKAKLALLGLEAMVQTADVPSKGVIHRVRVGPYAKLDQITSARAELAQNGFAADLVKIQNTNSDQ